MSAPAPDTASVPGAIPVYLSSFIGRDRELADLVALLGENQTRLLTLVGSGGIGKTRLAVQLAATVASDFEDGVIWVDLSGLTDPGHLPLALIDSLGVGEAPGESVEDRLVRLLSVRQAILVLDNCEHLLSAVRALAETILLRCPDIHVVTTSRELLGLPGETVRQVPPLGFASDAESNIEIGMESDAARMFVERAEGQGSFRFRPESARQVAAICRMVDGLPLGLELAAAQTRTLGVAQIASRLKQGLGLPQRQRPGQSDRQSSIGETLEWSYRLLDGAEQTLLRRLSVFRGPFSIEAAESVAADVDAPVRVGGVLVLDALTALVEKSVVQTLEAWAGSNQYRLLEPVRQFAADKLSEGTETDEVRGEYLRFYQQLAHDSASGLRGPEQSSWLRRLRAEDDNLRDALSGAVDQSVGGAEAAVALQMASDLFWYWNAADRFREGRAWLERCLALPSEAVSEQAIGDALWMVGTCAWLLGDLVAARRHLEEAEKRLSQIGDVQGVARVVDRLGRVRLYQGDPTGAVELLETSTAVFRKGGDPHDLGLSLTGLGVASGLLGRSGQALRWAHESLEIFELIGDPFFTALAVSDLGWVHYLTGDLSSAETCLESALELGREVNSALLTAQVLNQLAEVERYAGHTSTATSHLEESLALAEETGARGWIAADLRDIGFLALQGGDWAAASANLSEAAAHFLILEDSAAIARCLEGLAGITAAEDRAEEAHLLMAAAQPYREAAGPPLTPAGRSDLEWVQTLLRGIASVVLEGQPPSIEKALDSVRRTTSPPRELSTDQVKSELRIEALGPTGVIRTDRRLQAADWTYAKPRQLLFYLLDSGPRTKNEIGLAFWPDSSPDQVRRNVRSALYHLRRALGSRDWVVYEAGRYRFNRSLNFSYDVERFEELLDHAYERASEDPVVALEAFSQAVELYRGDYVADLEDDAWASSRREELRRRLVEALVTKASLEEASKNYTSAVASFRRVIGLDPYHDAAHLGLMTNLNQAGNRSAALRHYSEMAAFYQEELGASPGPAVNQLADLLRGAG